jgi:hypothetical protein
MFSCEAILKVSAGHGNLSKIQIFLATDRIYILITIMKIHLRTSLRLRRRLNLNLGKLAIKNF